jgi:hypothetical protein
MPARSVVTLPPNKTSGTAHSAVALAKRCGHAEAEVGIIAEGNALELESELKSCDARRSQCLPCAG